MCFNILIGHGWETERRCSVCCVLCEFVRAGWGGHCWPDGQAGSPKPASLWPLKVSPPGGRSSHWEPEVGPHLLTPVHLSCSGPGRALWLSRVWTGGTQTQQWQGSRGRGVWAYPGMRSGTVLWFVLHWGPQAPGGGIVSSRWESRPMAGASQVPGEGLNEN